MIQNQTFSISPEDALNQMMAAHQLAKILKQDRANPKGMVVANFPISNVGDASLSSYAYDVQIRQYAGGDFRVIWVQGDEEEHFDKNSYGCFLSAIHAAENSVRDYLRAVDEERASGDAQPGFSYYEDRYASTVGVLEMLH